MPAFDLPTDRRLVAAMVVLADEHDLPRKHYLRNLVVSGVSPEKMAEFTARYVKQSWKDLDQQLNERFFHDHGEDALLTTEETRLWPRKLMEATLEASGHAYRLRAAAQGPQGAPPDDRVWQALVAALTLVVVRARVNNHDTWALTNSVNTAIKMLGDL